MILQGTIVNGAIVLDGEPRLPEGTRVRVELDLDDLDFLPPTEEFQYPHPLAPYDREKENALLREAIASFDAGERGKPAAEVFDEIDRQLGQQAKGK